MEAFIMCGVPGSGKSTYVRENFPEAVVICWDSIREELYGDASVQGEWGEIQRRGVEILSQNVGKTIVVDATHCQASYRKDTSKLLRSYGYDRINLILVDKPLETCLQQNAERSRQVPEEVIERMYHSLQASKNNLPFENYSNVIVGAN